MSSKMQSSNNIAQARRTVQQLRIEASIERIKVQSSHIIDDSQDTLHLLLLLLYCTENLSPAQNLDDHRWSCCLVLYVVSLEEALTPGHPFYVVCWCVYPRKICTVLFCPAGVQGFSRPDALLWRTCQVWPPAHGHPCLRKPLQGQKALHYIVVGHLNSLIFF